MNRTHLLLLSLLLPLLSLNAVAYNRYQQSGKEDVIKKQADSVFRRLSLREKVSQLFIIQFDAKQSDAIKRCQNKLVRRKLGGIIIMDGEMIPSILRLNELQRIAKSPLLVAIDGEWGPGMRYPEISSFPRQMQLGALADDSLIYKMGFAIGKECRMLGVHLNFAPDVDINNNPDNAAINTRSFGEQREKVALFGAAYMRGMQDAGIATSAKHFPGHGDTNVDSHKGLPLLPFTMRRLDSLEIYPFKYLIDRGVDMVMIGHLQVPSLDSTGTPASVSAPVISGYLKGQLGYNGIVITDALEMQGLVKSVCNGDNSKIPLEAFKAGADILLMPKEVHGSVEVIVDAVRHDKDLRHNLDAKVMKVLMLKARLGLFSKAARHFQVDTSDLLCRINSADNELLIQALCDNSVTVVKDDYVIPLSCESTRKIAYVGYYGGDKSTHFADTLSANACIDTFFIRSSCTLEDLSLLRAKLSYYDFVVLGIHDTDSRPYKNFGLNNYHFNFFSDWASNQRIALVYFGSPYAMNKIVGIDNFASIVIAYSNSLYNNIAAAKILSGIVAPRGVLPVSAGGFKAGH